MLLFKKIGENEGFKRIQNIEWAESPPIFRLVVDQYWIFNGQFFKFYFILPLS